MNSITKLIALSLALLLSLTLATAQRGESKEKLMKNPEERAEKQTQKLTEKLSLTEIQVNQVAAINLDFAKKAEAIKAANEDRAASRAAMDALKTEQKAAIKTVLTPEQITQFEAMKDGKRGRKGKRGKDGRRGHGEGAARSAEDRAAHHTERLTEKLSLNEAQSNRIAAINLDFAKKAEAIKAANEDRAASREAMDALKTEQKAAIKTVLTPEQATQFEAMKDGRRGKGRHGKGAARSAEDRAAHHTERLTEKLSLNTAQTAQVAAINLDFAKKAEAIKAANEDRAAGKEAMDALRTAQKEAIKAVLTAEQLATFEAMKDGKRGKGRRGR